MKIGYSLLFFLIVSLSAPSLAQSKGGKPAGGPTTTELRGWRNTEWGMSSPDVLKLNPSFVIMPLEADNTRKVSGKIDIVACPFEVTLDFGTNDKLYMVSMYCNTLKADKFLSFNKTVGTNILGLLIKKYGQPYLTETTHAKWLSGNTYIELNLSSPVSLLYYNVPEGGIDNL